MAAEYVNPHSHIEVGMNDDLIQELVTSLVLNLIDRPRLGAILILTDDDEILVSDDDEIVLLGE